MEETVTQGIRRPQSPESFSYDEAMLLVSVSQCSSDECQKMPHTIIMLSHKTSDSLGNHQGFYLCFF